MRPTRVVPAVILACLAGLPASASAAERFYAATAGGRLVRVQSDSPGAIRSTRPITGLAEDGERILGLDIRPSTGVLYAISDASRLYRIDPGTARATPVGTGPIAPAVRDDVFGFDFDPADGLIRVVSRDGQNLRVNPDTLQVTVDRDVSFAESQVGIAPSIRAPLMAAVAYSGSTLYGLEQGKQALVRQQSPDAGTLTTIGAVGTPFAGNAGFDVARDGRAWAALRDGADSASTLYRVDLGSGHATRATARPAIGTTRGGRPDPVVALAAAGATANDTRAPRISARATRRVTRRTLLLRRTVTVKVRTNEAARLTLQLLAGRRVAGTAAREQRGTAGTTILRAKATAHGRALIRRRGGKLRYRVVARDEAGNRAVTRPRAQ